MRKRSVILSMLAVVMMVLLVIAGCKTERELSGIEITTPPDKIAYIEGETFDSTGMVVTANYSDETSEPVTNTP